MKRKRSTRKDAVTLAKASVIKAALQLLTPLALVRLLDQSEFGDYRLFWLIANTSALLLALGVDRSLLYFLPKSTMDERRRIVSQTMVYFLAAGLLAGLFLLGGNVWLPASVSALTDPGYLIAAFVFLWVASRPIIVLPTADRNVVWQSRIIIVVSILRALIVVNVAFFTGDIQKVFVALLAWAALQWIFLAYYVGSRYGLRLPLPTSSGLGRQLKYAVPFGLSRLFIGIRRQGEQWIVAFLFSPTLLGVFSIGMSFNIVLHLVRRSIGDVLLPKMSSSSAGGTMDRSLELNSRGNISVVTLVAPAVAFIWFFAEPLVRLLYTQDYIAAVPVLRIYMVNLLVMSTELATVLMVLEQGRHVAKVNAMMLVAGLLISYVGGRLFGLAGVALGALVGEITSRIWNYRHAARLLNIPVTRLQDWLTLVKIVLAAAIAGVISALVIRSIDQVGDFITLSLAALLYAIIYALALWILRLTWVLKAMADRGGWR